MSELTPSERQRLAEFMEWKYYHIPCFGGMYYELIGERLKRIVNEEDWHPDQSWEQCGMVHDDLITRGSSLRTSSGGDYSSAAVSDVPAVWIREPYRLQLAICRAALAWLGTQKGEA